MTEAGLWKRIRCALFHHRDKVWTPVHHSWDFHCLKCGMKGTVYD